jgi:hypothetical protein
VISVANQPDLAGFHQDDDYGTSLAATSAHTAAATSGDVMPRFPSGTSGQAPGALPPRAGPARAS